jgi:hypothetical protein
MKASKDRSEQFMHTASSAAQPGETDSRPPIPNHNPGILTPDFVAQRRRTIELTGNFSILCLYSSTTTNVFVAIAAPRQKGKTCSNGSRYACRNSRLYGIGIRCKEESRRCGLSGFGYERRWWRKRVWSRRFARTWIRQSANAADGTTGVYIVFFK